MRTYYVYILSNPSRTVLYVGVTNGLARRMFEHKQHLISGFTKRYNVVDLVYWEETNDVETAISREKQLKGWSRSKKNCLIEKMNPQWRDLADSCLR